jgi:beta-lactam-binding protein with PASTA domain
LEQGKTVIIKASAGVGEVELPNYHGQPANQASEDLEKLGLKANIRWVQWAETTSNVVLKQDPEAGTKVKKDAEVEFMVNR